MKYDLIRTSQEELGKGGEPPAGEAVAATAVGTCNNIFTQPTSQFRTLPDNAKRLRHNRLIKIEFNAVLNAPVILKDRRHTLNSHAVRINISVL